MSQRVALGIVVMVWHGMATGEVRHVPEQYQTIQQAITAASDGDEVVIAPGIYSGTNNRDLKFLGKAITVRSTNPADPTVVAATVIDCGNERRGFTFVNGESAASVVSGLTIRNGFSDGGGAILCENTSPTISNCTIETSVTTTTGGGILLSGSDSLISRCTISSNEAHFGGGIGVVRGSAIVRDCIIAQNHASSASGGAYAVWGTPLFLNCLIVGNSAGEGWQAGGIGANGTTELRVINCTVSGNTSEYGGGLWVNGKVTLVNSVLWGNQATRGAEVSVTQQLDVSYCDIKGGQPAAFVSDGSLLNWLMGNIDADPHFIDADFRLGAGSPCIDAGDNATVPVGILTDLDGHNRFFDDASVLDTGLGLPPIVDMGAYEFDGGSVIDPDTDDDGVLDIFDVCPNTIPGAKVDSTGCPPVTPGDFDHDGDVDMDDFAIFQRCMSGANVPADPDCAK